MKKSISLFLAALLLLSAAALRPAYAAGEAFKKGLAYLLSGSVVYQDAECGLPEFKVTADTGVYVLESVSGGKTLKSNDILKIAIALNGKAREMYVRFYDLQYMTKKQIASYAPGPGTGVYGVTLGNAETAAVPSADPAQAKAAEKTPAPQAEAETPAPAKAEATAVKATAAPTVTPVPATPEPTPTPKPVYAAFIALQPEDGVGQLGAKTALSLMAENAVSYQWQYNDGAEEWKDIEDGASFEGSKTSSLSILMDEANQLWRYRCLVRGEENELISDEAGLTVSTALLLLSEPQDAIAKEGSQAVFEAAAVNAATWEWQTEAADGEWTAVDAAQVQQEAGVSRLTVDVTAATKGAKFRCVITGVEGEEVETRTVTVVTGAAVRIVTQPENVTAANGGTAVLHVEAENALSYQWQYDDGISGWWDLVERDDRIGTMTDTLTLSVRPTVASFTYRCVITGAENTVETRPVSIKIK